MKTTIKLVLVITMLGMMACGQSKKEKDTTAKDVKEELQDVVEVSKEYTSEMIDDLNAEINKMQESVKDEMKKVGNEYDAMSDKLKAKYKNQKAELEKQQTELDKKIGEFNEAADEKKAELKAEAGQLRTAFYKSIEAFKKEMAKDNT